MHNRNRAILIVLDGVGIGEMEDSHLYGDQGSNSLGNTAKALGGLDLPNLEKLGLGRITYLEGVRPVDNPLAAFGRMREMSPGKDSTTGHWEMMGLVLKDAFPTYPQGFPDEIIKEFEKRIGRKTLGNVVASGTAIIEELGPQHQKSGLPIVYTSADSVFQIAAHEQIIRIEELYAMCNVARDLLSGRHAVGRVIARPFIGEAGAYQRTANRHDFSLRPETNILDYIQEKGKEVIGIGKILDLFAGRGVSRSLPTKSNQEGIRTLQDVVHSGSGDLIFINLLDFDQTYGHRNDIKGYAAALEEFDRGLAAIMDSMKEKDILFISSDHGNDPTTPSTDHSREYVPLLVYGKNVRPGIDLGTRDSFSDLGQTIAQHLGVEAPGLAGQSFYHLLRKKG